MAWYRNWFNTPYYDALYSHRDGTEAKEFINRILEHLHPDHNSIMADVPCGSGRHAQFLAEAGYEVYGYDLSKKNIENALRLSTDQLHFAVLDMRQMFHVRFFDYVFNLFTSLGYFDTDRYDQRILQNFHAALVDDGTLVIDFFNTYYALAHLKESESITRGGYHFDITKNFNGTHIIKEIIVDAEPADTYIEKVRAYTVEDFDRMISKAGFHISDRFGDYDLHPFDEQQSPRLILIADKK